MKDPDKRTNNKLISVVSFVGFFVCALALLYPIISNKWNNYRDMQIIESYVSEIDNGDKDLYESELQKAHDYNKTLYSLGENIINGSEYEADPYYDKMLNATGSGIMCYIEIPKIGVTEPVYHYSNEESLQKGIGHIKGSSLPVGDVNTHAVLTGHRGLPTQKLFTDLDRVENGDVFYIHVLGHTLAYIVFDIDVVTPDDVGGLLIESGKDVVTLVTCEPYGINTHRLLITGRRIDFDESTVVDGLAAAEDHQTVIDPALVIFIGFMLFAAVFGVIVLIGKLRAKRRIASAFAKKSRAKPKRRKAESPAHEYDYDYDYEERSRSKHSPIYYVIIGIAVGAAVIGAAVIIYKLVKKRRSRSDKK